MSTKIKKILPLVLLIAVVAVFPLVSDGYILSIGISVMIAALLGQSWNLMSGYAGQFSFGHAAFFGLGAYTSSILYMDYGITPWIGMLAGMAVAGLVGIIIGYLSFRYRLKGDYFALATLAFAEILRILFNNIKALKGAAGILIPYRQDWTAFAFKSDRTYFYVISCMVAMATFCIWWIMKHRIGLNLVAIRENQDAAGSLGVNVLKYKLIAIAVSAAMAAMAGAFYAQYYGFIDPTVAFAAEISVEAIVPCIIGGAGTFLGPIFGAFLIIPIQEICNSLFTNIGGINMIVYGAVIVVFIIFCPNGFYGKILKRKRKNERNSVSSKKCM